MEPTVSMDAAVFPWQPNNETDREMVGCVNYGGGMYLYASGFEEGADALFNALKEAGAVQDFLVYPLVYCLRHAVELALKQVIRAGRQLLDDEEPGFPYEHDLWKLWLICGPILRRLWPQEGNESSYFVVENTVRSFRQIDRLGEGFRYPVTRDRKTKESKATLDAELRHLDLDQMYREVKTTLSLLMAADTGIDFYMDAKSDAEAEYREIQREMRAEYEREMRAEYEAEMRADHRDAW